MKLLRDPEFLMGMGLTLLFAVVGLSAWILEPTRFGGPVLLFTAGAIFGRTVSENVRSEDFDVHKANAVLEQARRDGVKPGTILPLESFDQQTRSGTVRRFSFSAVDQLDGSWVARLIEEANSLGLEGRRVERVDTQRDFETKAMLVMFRIV